MTSKGGKASKILLVLAFYVNRIKRRALFALVFLNLAFFSVVELFATTTKIDLSLHSVEIAEIYSCVRLLEGKKS